MSEIKGLAGRLHWEFCNIVDLTERARELGEEDLLESIFPRWALALDILGKTARVFAGAKVVLGKNDKTLTEFAQSPFCFSWYRDAFQLRNTECWAEWGDGRVRKITCDKCRAGGLPCQQTLLHSEQVQRGMDACRAMRNRYEHYEGYFIGAGNEQKRANQYGFDQRKAARPFGEPWRQESSNGGPNSMQIRIDVYERGGLRAFVLDVEKIAAGLKPVVQAVINDERVYREDHTELCRYCGTA